jgi:uncharacterized protein involved in outer membrane biogenesis
MNIKKVAKISGAVIGGIVLLILIIFLFLLGPTVKLIAQTIGPKALGTPLTINRLKISPGKGTIHLSDFAIANPASFGKSNAVSLASLDISIDMGSIFTKTVVVHEVSLNSPHFVYEQSMASDNISEFIRNIEEFTGYDPEAPVEEKPKKEKTPKKDQHPKIVIVEALTINDMQAHMANTDDSLLDMTAGFDRLHISMTNGTVLLDDLYISNPGRLETPNLFELDELAIHLEPGSVYSSNFTVKAVQITKPHAFIEHNPTTDTAWEFLKIADSIITKIPTNAPKSLITNETAVAETDELTESKKELILESITIDDMRLNVVNTADPKQNVYLGMEKLSVSPVKGRVQLDYLHFTNPARLTTPDLFALEQLSVALNPESLKTETVVVDDITLTRPYAMLELHQEVNTVSELMQIAIGFMERVPQYPIPQLPASPPTEEPVAVVKSTEETAPPIALHNLLVDDIRINFLDTTPTNKTTHAPITLAGIEAIQLSLTEGKLQINNIYAPNAEGFTASNLFHLASIDVDIEPESLFSDQVVIQKVFVHSPDINLEQTEESGNVVALQTPLMKMVPPAGDKPEGKPPVAAHESKEDQQPVPMAEQPLVLHQLIVTNLSVSLKLPVATNATGGVIGLGMVDVKKINPMDKLSLNKLNPLAGGEDPGDDPEADPDAPLTMIAFDQLSVEPLKGLLYIDGMHISNPPGFSRRDLVSMQEFRIDLDPDTLTSGNLLIEDILIAKPRVRYERQITSDNIKALQMEIEQAVVRRGEQIDKAVPEKPEETSGAADEQKVIIEHVLIDSGVVQAKLSALPALTVPLPKIELRDIGKEKGGASVEEASKQVFDTFYDSMIGAVGGATGFAGDALKGVGTLGADALGGVTKGVVGETEKVIENVKQGRKKRRGVTGKRSALQ